MKERKRKVYPDDDGRVISPMNIDGMPWYHPHAKKAAEEGTKPEPPSGKETFRLIMRLYAAALPIALVFIAAFAALICFMVFVWFK